MNLPYLFFCRRNSVKRKKHSSSSWTVYTNQRRIKLFSLEWFTLCNRWDSSYVNNETKINNSIARRDKPRTRCIIECFIKIKHVWNNIENCAAPQQVWKSNSWPKMISRKLWNCYIQPNERILIFLFREFRTLRECGNCFNMHESIFCWSLCATGNQMIAWIIPFQLWCYVAAAIRYEKTIHIEVAQMQNFGTRTAKCVIDLIHNDGLVFDDSSMNWKFFQHPHWNMTIHCRKNNLEVKTSIAIISNYIRVCWHYSKISYSIRTFRSD